MYTRVHVYVYTVEHTGNKVCISAGFRDDSLPLKSTENVFSEAELHLPVPLHMSRAAPKPHVAFDDDEFLPRG